MINSNEPRVIVVDGDDREIGHAGKLEAHISPGVRHRAFSLMVHDDVHPTGRWLLQQRASTKYHFAGLWSNTCCSHPAPGEHVLDAARRRLFEELGMTATAFRQVGRFEHRAVDPVSGLVEHEVVQVILAQAATEPRPEPGEVDGVRWSTIGDVLDELESHPSSFTPWFPTVLPFTFDIDRRTATGGRQ